MATKLLLHNSSRSPEQMQREQFAGSMAFSFLATCILHLVPFFFFGAIYLISQSEGFWNAFVCFFGLIQLVYMLPLILHCMSRKAHGAMAGFILGAALTFELGIPLAGFGLVCAAP